VSHPAIAFDTQTAEREPKLDGGVVRVSEGLEWVIDLEPLPGEDDHRPRGGFIEDETVPGVVTFKTKDATWNGEAWMRAVPHHFRTPYLRPVWHDEPREGPPDIDFQSSQTTDK
jgi:hypothetical protein